MLLCVAAAVPPTLVVAAQYQHIHFCPSCALHSLPEQCADHMASRRYKYVLRQNLARTEPGNFVFVNAWNEWGEGAALEPSVQWGRRWLEATLEAVQEERSGQVNWKPSRMPTDIS